MNTASSFISFHGKLENRVREFYEELANDTRFSKWQKTFKDFSIENKKHGEIILRSYREVITDALEAGFPSTVLNEVDYQMDTEILPTKNLDDILKGAIKIEETSRKYCLDVSRSLEGLLADVPETFKWVATRKAKRERTLESILKSK